MNLRVDNLQVDTVSPVSVFQWEEESGASISPVGHLDDYASIRYVKIRLQDKGW